MLQKTWSYWEREFFPQKSDLIIVGAGFTGLSAAIHAALKFPNWRILVLERGAEAEGASSKNAGFACYGTIGEILSDIQLMGKEAALNLVCERLEGLAFLKDIVGEHHMDWQKLGGTEVYLKGEEDAWDESLSHLENLNQGLKELTQANNLFQECAVPQNLKSGIGAIYSPLEAQLHPAKALRVLQSKAQELGVKILKGVEVLNYYQEQDWRLETTAGNWICDRLLYCTNAFGMPGTELDIVPARNQVLISKAFDHGLPLGNYHAQEGYLYFRTVGRRLLIGGARHLDTEAETTSQLGLNTFLQDHLKRFVAEDLQMQGFEVEQQWSGIIATGKSKQFIAKALKPNLWYCGRFGGMGVALSTKAGKEIVDLIE